MTGLLLFTVVPAFTFLPSAAVGATGGEHGRPTSTVKPLPEYTANQVVTISYTSFMHGKDSSGGDEEEDGVTASAVNPTGMHALSTDGHDSRRVQFWTELFYRTSAKSPWTLYTPPWNSNGRWVGTRESQREGAVTGLIPFDTFYTGGETHYGFTTVAVHTEFGREVIRGEKANTTVDSHAPQLFIATPTPRAWTNHDVLRWRANDTVSGVASVIVSLDGSTPVLFRTAEGETELGARPGNHTVSVIATDRAGNPAKVIVPFRFDPNAPSLSFTSPARDSYVRTKSVNVSWTASDSVSGLASLRLSVDSGASIDLALDATSHELSDLSESGHVVTLVATDLAGNEAMETRVFAVDATPPRLVLVAPTGKYVNTKDLQLYWAASDSNSGIDRYELALDGGPPVTVNETYGYSFPAVSEGPHTVVVRAFDRAGNEAPRSVTVFVDVTPPQVSLTNPKAGTTVYGVLQVNWTYSDQGSGIDRVEFLFDQDSVVATGAPGATVPSPSVGPHFARIRATDRAGNLAEGGTPFTYGGAAPQGPFGISPLDFGILIAILVAIAVVAAYVAVRRRRRAGPP